jgi:hypothetical protein
MCTGGEDKITKNEIFSKQFQFAWEHFRFHAEQRIRLFNFFIIFLGLFGSAFALIAKDAPVQFKPYAFLAFCAGGFVSAIFLSLDIRNTQLVHQSEKLLKKLEENALFCGEEWHEDLGYGQVKLGILSREAILSRFRKDNYPIISKTPLRFIFVDNIKHTFSIRIIHFLALVSFWLLAIMTVPDPPHDKLDFNWTVITWKSITSWGFGLSLAWSIWAMLRPDLDLSCEPRALTWLKEKSQG